MSYKKSFGKWRKFKGVGVHPDYLKPKPPNIVDYVNRALSGVALNKKGFPNHWAHDDYVKWAESEYYRHYPKQGGNNE